MSILEFEKQQGGATDYELIMDDDMYSVADRSSILSRESNRNKWGKYLFTSFEK